MRSALLIVAAFFAIASNAYGWFGSPWHFHRPQTIAEKIHRSDAAVWCRLVKSKVARPDGTWGADLEIKAVAKPHQGLQGMRVFSANGPWDDRYVQIQEVFVLLNFYKGTPELQHLHHIPPQGDGKRYVESHLKVQSDKRVDEMRVAFDFLESRDPFVRQDAWHTMTPPNAIWPSQEESKHLAGAVPASVIAERLQKDSDYRNFYAELLGLSDSKAHAIVLEQLWLDPKKRTPSVMLAYATLEPTGVASVEAIVCDTKLERAARSTAFELLRVLHQRNRIDNVRMESVCLRLAKEADPTLAVDAIEWLRQTACWNRTAEVVALGRSKQYDTALLRRVVLRFALQSPEPAATTFVQETRQTHADEVAETEQSFAAVVGFEKLPNARRP